MSPNFPGLLQSWIIIILFIFPILISKKVATTKDLFYEYLQER